MRSLEKEIKALELKYGVKKVAKAIEEMLSKRIFKVRTPYKRDFHRFPQLFHRAKKRKVDVK